MFKTLLLALFIVLISTLVPQGRSKVLHKWCSTSVKSRSIDYTEEKLALLCGSKKIKQHKKSILIQSGIIHIFVVSGAHINFYKMIASKLFNIRIAQIFILLLLPIYCLICNGSPPVLRATIDYYINTLNKKFKINLLKSEIILVSVIGACLINLENSLSISLYLSWMCTLIYRRQEFNIKAFIIYLTASPILLLFSVPSPLVTLPNFMFSIILAPILLPMALISIFLPAKLSKYLDEIFSHLYIYLEILSVEIKIVYFQKIMSQYYLIVLIIIYLLATNLYLINRDKFYEKYI